MIFSSFRDSVQEIAEMLSQHRPVIRVMTFVGHASGKSTKGFTQKEQLEVMWFFLEVMKILKRKTLTCFVYMFFFSYPAGYLRNLDHLQIILQQLCNKDRRILKGHQNVLPIFFKVFFF